jgi:pimeloyl-ACP methyl ester carboxylesterase
LVLPAERQSVRANELDVAYVESGSGPAVLLFHGFPDIATTFGPLIERIVQAGYRCVAPWLRGYWPTSPGRFYDEGSLVADAISLVERLNLAPVRVVGHDWGADVAYGLATARPDLVVSVVAMAVPHTRAIRANRRGDFDQLKRSWYAWMFQVPGLAEVVVPHDGWRFIRRLWTDWSPGWSPPPEHLDRVVEMLERPDVLTAAVAYYRALFDPGLRNPATRDLLAAVEIGPVTSPTLLLMGEKDGCVSPAMAAGSEVAFEGAYRVEVLGGCGHFLHLERPDDVASLVLEWFRAASGDWSGGALTRSDEWT